MVLMHYSIIIIINNNNNNNNDLLFKIIIYMNIIINKIKHSYMYIHVAGKIIKTSGIQ